LISRDQYFAEKRLWSLYQLDPMPVDRLVPGSSDQPNAIFRIDHGYRRSMFHRSGITTMDQFPADQAADPIVDKDHALVADRRQTVANTLEPRSPARHDLDPLRESRAGDQRPRRLLVMSRRDKHHGHILIGTQKGIQRIPQDRPAAKLQELLGRIRAHPRAGPTGNDHRIF